VKGLTHRDFESYSGPIPLDIAKQWDLRKLSKYLINYLTQPQIDALYPEPNEDEADSASSEDEDDPDDSD
jgi:hypothetical protein